MLEVAELMGVGGCYSNSRECLVLRGVCSVLRGGGLGFGLRGGGRLVQTGQWAR